MGRAYRDGQILQLRVNETWPEQLDPTETRPGLLSLSCENLAPSASGELVRFLQERGPQLGYLTVESRYVSLEKGIDLSGVDLLSLCPQLKRVSFQGVQLQASLLRLSSLERAFFQDCTLLGSEPMALGWQAHGAGSQLTELVLQQSVWQTDELAFGPESRLRELEFHFEAHTPGPTPARFRFQDCPVVARVQLTLARVFALHFAGRLPELKDICIDEGFSGNCTLDYTQLHDTRFTLNRTIYT